MAKYKIAGYDAVDFEDMLNERLKDPEFKKGYDALEREFALASDLISLRAKKKLSQKELAKKARTSVKAVVNLESGDYENLSMPTLEKVGRVLGVRPEIHFKPLKAS